ncbi:sensor histidine kinase [Microbacterium sp.]|uniref:sensor histidine kinase n=1 Tax=Microbacterium sp. TaxID=51671 RepID=UPI003A8C40C3
MTVAVLTIGLLIAGVGTMVFLRNAQLSSIDEQLTQLAPTDVTSSLMTVTVFDGVPRFVPNVSTPATQYFVAVYGPTGDLLATAGGGRSARPDFPDSFPLDRTQIRGTTPFTLNAEEGAATFHASVDFLGPIEGVRDNYTQLVALPLTTVTQTVTNYVGIYTILAIFTVIVGALLTRWLVTLAFRGLGQVEETAMSIAAGNLSQRMGEIAPGTEVGKLKIALNAMLDRVDRALALRDASVLQMRRFIGDASHELRTPLVTVRGYAELYRMGAITSEEQTAQSMERIEKEAIRMGGLVEDLLSLARLDERRDMTIEPVDLRPVARDAALDAHATSPDRVVTFVDTTADLAHAGETGDTSEPVAVEPARRPPGGRFLARRRRASLPETPPQPTPAPAPRTEDREPVVLGDEDRIRQVVANLLGNARRYTPEGSPIELTVGIDPTMGMGWIAVIDHGEGIPAPLRDKVFQRFWRADTSRARETGGSGLGLSIVASVVEALHGAIEVTETPGGGATFRASFPLARARDSAEHLLIQTQPLPRLQLDD